MGKLDRSLWQWTIRRPGTIDWRPLGRCLTETEARQWAVANGYEIRRGAEVDGAVRNFDDQASGATSARPRSADTSL